MLALPLLILALLPPAAPASPSDPQALALLADMRESMGGDERLEAIHNVRSKGKVAWGGAHRTGTVEIVATSSGDGRMRTSFGVFGEFEVGVAGELAWDRSPSGLRILDELEAGELRRRFARTALGDWSTSYARAELAEETMEVEGRRCSVLLLHPRAAEGDEESDVPPDNWFVDQLTNLPARIVAVTGRGPGGVQRTTFDYGDWRLIDGVRHPFRQQAMAAGMRVVTTLEKVEHNVELEEGALAAPEDVVAKARSAVKRPVPPSPPGPRDGEER